MTLVDLMTTLGAAALVLTLGVPSFRGLQADMQRTQVRYALMGSFSLARAEAIRRGVPVTICPSADGLTCSKDSATNWSGGWLVAVNEGGTDQVLDRVRFAEPTFSLQADASIARGVTFQSSGFPSSNGIFSYRDDTTNWEVRLIPIGRLEAASSLPPSS